MDTLGSLYNELKSRLIAAEIETAEQDSRLILEKRAKASWSDLIAHPERMVPKDIQTLCEGDVTARICGQPLSKLYGTREFWGLEFVVSEDVLDPRPDTETLIETALKKFEGAPPKKILDLGTGSGCILISLLKEWPKTHGTGIDISPKAIKIAAQNAKNHGVEGRIEFIESSWLDNLGDSDFDLIISNPPYISSKVIPQLSKEVQEFDPILALDGGENGLEAYKKILLQIKNKINHPVNILFEIGYDQQQDLTRLAEESRFVVNGVYRDLLGNPRVVDISSGDK